MSVQYEIVHTTIYHYQQPVSFDEAEDLLPPRLAHVLEWARATITGN